MKPCIVTSCRKPRLGGETRYARRCTGHAHEKAERDAARAARVFVARRREMYAAQQHLEALARERARLPNVA